MDVGTRFGGVAAGPVKGAALLLVAILVAATAMAGAMLAGNVLDGGIAAVEAAGTPPVQPVNLSPADNATEVSLNPTLQSSAFSDNDTDDTHRASQWQITATADDYASAVFDTTTTDNASLIQIDLPGGKLSDNTTYFWHVRHQDSQEAWSDWSPQTSFTTLNHQPGRPSGVAPSDNTTVSLNPTLQSSPFSDPDANDTHAASQWRISAFSDNYTSPVYDTTATDNASLTRIDVPGGKLSDNTAYFWQVRHRDNHDTWSEWSPQISFTTLNHAPATPATASPISGESVNVTVTLQSSAFSDPDANDTQGASRWQITVTAGDYSDAALVLDDITVSESQLTEVTVFAGVLSPNNTYFWRVRHQDNHGAWSADWSVEASFTTVNRPPDKPADLSPKSGSLGVITAPRLESEFSDPDGDPDYAATQWQITATTWDDAGLIWEETTEAAYVSVPQGKLSPGTTYYWRVRHQDKQGEWSEWSDEATFTTWTGLPSVGGGLPFWAWLLISLGGVTAVSAAVAVVLRARGEPQKGPRADRRRQG
jgi:hypothetical protein